MTNAGDCLDNTSWWYRVTVSYATLYRHVRTGRFVRRWYAKRFPRLVREQMVCTSSKWEKIGHTDSFFLRPLSVEEK